MRGFYSRLAWNGIRTNRRMYLPYILTCAGMVAMEYIMLFLAHSPAVSAIKGGSVLPVILDFGSGVIGVFMAVFLFYTNSFLMRRRKREFGLYNILGMGKGNIARVLAAETLMTAAVSFAAGTAAGVLLAELAELALVKLAHGSGGFAFAVSRESLLITAAVFGGVSVLLLLNSLRSIHFSNPMELLKSEAVGEKPPKANWVLGVLGFAVLGYAYYIAMTIDKPLEALVWFFVAVLLVIAATYLLFVAGSVVICRVLQRRKRYYYDPRHFISVSSMAYRMKRNGAGLASICILATMVIVMISSTSCLYFGTEGLLRSTCQRDLFLSARFRSVGDIRSDSLERMKDRMQTLVREAGGTARNVTEFRSAEISGLLENGRLEPDPESVSGFGASSFDGVVCVVILPLDDYNRETGQSLTLADGEALVGKYRGEYSEPVFSVGELWSCRALPMPDNELPAASVMVNIADTMFVAVPDFDAVCALLEQFADSSGREMLSVGWSYGFDLDLPDSAQVELYEKIRPEVHETIENLYYSSLSSIASERGDFSATYGGLFFLGIMLSVVFSIAAVLIIYYKQVSEGFEDRSRFEIMQKVGMTGQDIRRSINSQMLTVFLLPIAAAVLHFAFAFRVIEKLLLLFNLNDRPLLLATAGISILVAALLYAAVYRLTSNAYYAIVAGAKEK